MTGFSESDYSDMLRKRQVNKFHGLWLPMSQVSQFILDTRALLKREELFSIRLCRGCEAPALPRRSVGSYSWALPIEE